MKALVDSLSPRGPMNLAEAASGPDLVDSAVREIGEAACSWAIETATRIVAEVEREFGSTPGTRALTGFEREAFEASLLTTLIALHRETPPERLVRPKGAEENVRQSARQGVPMGTLLRIVWACHNKTQIALARELEALVDPPELLEQLHHLNADLHAYLDSYVKELTAEYQDELVAWAGHIPAERLQLMNALLDGEPPSAAAERTLGLALTGHHLLAAAWQWSARHTPDRQAELSRYGATVARQLGASRHLVLHHDGVAELWWTFAGAPPSDYVEIVRAVELPPWTRMAIGTAAPGIDGLRASHRAAQQALAVGKRSTGGPLWAYRDVSVVALLNADDAAARHFVHEELAGLLSGEPKVAELRNTLRCFLKTGNSRIAAARELNLAANTVAYRVSRAGELLGRPSTHRPTETLLALELVHYFPDYLSTVERAAEKSTPEKPSPSGSRVAR